MAFYCYILQCADGTLYTGYTVDPLRRERQHNAGRGSRYTRTRRPVQIVYLEELPDRLTAMRRERSMKNLSRPQKLALIARYERGQHE